MSDLADAVFGGQLLGHIIAGEELTSSLIADAAINADLASHIVVDHNLSPCEQNILEAKVAQNTIAYGHYETSHLIGDHLDSQLLADFSGQLNA